MTHKTFSEVEALELIKTALAAGLIKLKGPANSDSAMAEGHAAVDARYLLTLYVALQEQQPPAPQQR